MALFEAPASPPTCVGAWLTLLPVFVAGGGPEAAVEAVELLSSAMVVDRCWVLGVTCVRRVEIVLVVVKIVEIIQLVHSVLVSLSAVRETIKTRQLNKIPSFVAL